MAINFQADIDSGPSRSVERIHSPILCANFQILLQTLVLWGYKPGPQGSVRVQQGQRRMQRTKEIKVGKNRLQQTDYAPLRHHIA